MNQPPLNPDALRRADDAVSELYADGHCPKAEDAAEVAVSAYLAVALPEPLATSKPEQNFEVVRTVEELEALPGKTIVLTAENGIYLRHKNGHFLAFGLDVRLHPESIILPARVLYRPEVRP